MLIRSPRVAVLAMVLALTAAVSAQSASTQRALRNIEIALNITIPEALTGGTVPKGKEADARILAKDLDDRVQRARAYFKTIDAADTSSPAVVAIAKRLNDMDQLRTKLGAAVTTQNANAADAKTQHFAFMAELKVHEPAILKFGEITTEHDRDIINSISPQAFKKWVDELDVVNDACTTRYKGIQNHPTYSLNRLATSPADWCKIAAQRETYAHRAVVNHVQAMSVRKLKDLQDIAKTPTKNDGYLMNWVVTAVSEPQGIKPQLIAEAKPWFAIVGKEIPEGFFGPVDKVVQDAIAAIDRTSSTWTYPADRFHDARIEGVVQKQMAAGVKVVRTSLAAEGWTIDKNALGVVLDRYRTGHILFKMPTLNWCSLREFTYLETATGATFQPATSATMSEAVRFQACK